MKRRRKDFHVMTVLLLVLLLTVFAFMGCSPAEQKVDESNGEESRYPTVSDDPYIQGLYEAALESGKTVVNYYNNVAAMEPNDVVRARFEEQFPGITLRVSNKTGAATLEQFLSEKRAGLNICDIIQYPGMAPFLYEFQDEGFIQEYYIQDIDQYPESQVVKGYAYPINVYSIGCAWNTELLTKEERDLLRTFEGWTDPRFKGRVNICGPTGGSTQRFIYYMWQHPDYGPEWWQKIADLDPVIFTSVTPAGERVAAGEFDVSFVQISVIGSRLQPAPVNSGFGEFAVTSPTLTAIASNAPNLDAAKLFMEWLFSRDGQQTYSLAGGFLSVRLDMSGGPVLDYDWFEFTDDHRSVDEADFAANNEQVFDEWRTMFKWAE